MGNYSSVVCCVLYSEACLLLASVLVCFGIGRVYLSEYALHSESHCLCYVYKRKSEPISLYGNDMRLE